MNRTVPREESSTELRGRLLEADPLRDETAAAEEERALVRLAARLAVVEAERRPRSAPALTWPALAFVALVALAWIGTRFAERRPPRERGASAEVVTETTGVRDAARGASSSPAEPDTRQVQFVTAGGTRVIWVLDPRFVF